MKKSSQKMSSSAICPRFAQNAWKKDLCSNCFKSKEEHSKAVQSASATKQTSSNATKKTEIPNKNMPPPKGIIKSAKAGATKPKQKFKVNFRKELTQVIGYGGEWSDQDDDSDEDDFMTPVSMQTDDVPSTDEEENLELKRLTKSNTDFNTNNGNLLGDPEENIKKSFAALKLGAPQVDKEGKKQTLKISVVPFGSTSSMKAKFEQKPEEVKASSSKKSEVSKLQVTPSTSFKELAAKESSKKAPVADGKSSPPIERAMEKSLLEEISETLEQNQKDVKKFQSDKDGKIKFEITSLTDTLSPKPFPELKKPIARNAPITKDHVKPKVNIYPKYSDTDSNCSDSENGISAYYDVVETAGYENLPDGKSSKKDDDQTDGASDGKKAVFSSSQYITDMLLSAKTRSASYSLHEGRFITSKITADGLIVTKCSSDDALDSTGSSFDGSSDEETSYSMNRSESDSGIGISIGSSDYKGTAMKEKERVEQKLSASTNNSDYEDIQVVEDVATPKVIETQKKFPVEKSRELAGEPDGSADPDGNAEAVPALPKSPPPTTEPKSSSSFLHGLQKNKKPEVPAKPASVQVMKSFAKRQPSLVEQQVISQLQQVIKTPEQQEKHSLTRKEGNDQAKLLKKGRAPDPPCDDIKTSPPPTPEKDYSMSFDAISSQTPDEPNINECNNKKGNSSINDDIKLQKIDEQHSSIYTRNPTMGLKSTAASPVIREKDKRERTTINPKFRSLNTFSSHRKNALPPKPSTPEPAPRKNLLSMSEECLALDDKKKKNKFSIKKFLRMGTSKTTDNLHKKEGIYSEIATGDEMSGISGKPRLVIIHPIDINPTAVEVVKDITQTGECAASQTVVVTTKPPAPPLRASEGNRCLEANKPARPPPPKSAELRRKQKIGFNINLTGGSVKCKSDNVYANLGEIRSAMAPRKPERTASMREREAQLELARKRHGCESSDSISVCSSNGGTMTNNSEHSASSGKSTPTPESQAKSADQQPSSKTSTFDRKTKETDGKVASKLEIFEKGIAETSRPTSLKDSVRKINSTIDSYLKDKRDYENMYDFIKSPASPPPTPARAPDTVSSSRNTLTAPHRRTHFSDNASVSGVSYTRSEYAHGQRYGLTGSLANIPRVVSASYCGSEMGESDIYSPYSYYGSEAGGDVGSDINDAVWGTQTTTKNRVKTTNRLRMRKGRSVVHKSIEDNYTAVVVANHEALAQVLDQLQQTPIIPPALRPLANAINLRFEDFQILEGVQAFVVGKKAFHAAVWSTSPVTLALSVDCNQLSGAGGELSHQLTGGVSGVLNPITEFCDLVPNYHLPLMPSTEVRRLQATISVLPRLQFDTLQTIGGVLMNKSQMLDKTNFNFRGSIPNLTGQLKESSAGALRNVCSVQNLSTLSEIREKSEDMAVVPGMPSFDDVMCREVGFIMLQLINGLKNLQAKAIEEMPLSLSNVILCKDSDNKDTQSRLCVLQGCNNDEEEPVGTLCKCAHVALTEILPPTKLTPILADILVQERSESLSKAKSVLEFALWGPSDVTLSGSTKERELALQRWLDLERATVLHGLVRTRVELTVYDECHLMFLVRSNAKMMNDAAKIVSSFQCTAKE